MTQKDRVLAALRAHTGGVTQVDFLLPDVIDAGAPITRVAARIEELRDEGHKIVDGGDRDKCTIYRLTEVAGNAPAGMVPGETPGPVELPHETPADASPATPQRLRTADVIGAHHVCDHCELRWHSRQPPTYCPSCKRSCLWIASFFSELDARVYVPLPDPQALAA